MALPPLPLTQQLMPPSTQDLSDGPPPSSPLQPTATVPAPAPTPTETVRNTAVLLPPPEQQVLPLPTLLARGAQLLNHPAKRTPPLDPTASRLNLLVILVLGLLQLYSMSHSIREPADQAVAADICNLSCLVSPSLPYTKSALHKMLVMMKILNFLCQGAHQQSVPPPRLPQASEPISAGPPATAVAPGTSNPGTLAASPKATPPPPMIIVGKLTAERLHDVDQESVQLPCDMLPSAHYVVDALGRRGHKSHNHVLSLWGHVSAGGNGEHMNHLLQDTLPSFAPQWTAFHCASSGQSYFASCDQAEKLYSSDLQAISKVKVGHGESYEHDSIASCGAFADVCVLLLLMSVYGS